MLGRLAEWMEEAAVDAALVTHPVSVAYLTGFRAEPHERLMALVVRPDRALLVVPWLEEEAACAAARGVEVRAWRDGEDPWAVVGAALGRPRRLGVEKAHLTISAWERLQESVQEGEPVDVGAEIRRLRARKTPEEIARLERAARITDEVTERALRGLEPGRTELEVAAALDLAVAAGGAVTSFATLVQSGENTARPHQPPGDRRLRPGDLVLVDFGAAWEGYRADTTRTVVLGEPDARQRELHGLVLEAHDAGIAAVRAGVTAGEVDEAARSVLRDAGLGERFIHRLGHGLGLEPHEAPSLDPGGGTVLEAGMVITIEPGVYIPGWGGIRIEDDVVVEPNGCRVLTRAGRGLRPDAP
ncbi:MAG TPA: Xaa-Pro peptidase family protein [Candidatus Dormibacteraeota bacterium]|nr:Xaa-Pro peptidase family protein [Candidatus Dormibacteraeota bacterium]